MSVCSLHGKKRGEDYLVSDRKGGMKCAPGSKCQMPGDEGGGQKRSAYDAWGMNPMMQMMMQGYMPAKKWKKTGNGGQRVCSVHFKERSMQSLEEDGNGGHSCVADDQCKVGSGGDLRAQYCSVHKKKRSEQSLVDDGAGGYKCGEDECKVAPEGSTEQVECSAHKKTRSMQNCEDDGKGGYKCSKDSKCQIEGGKGGKGKGGGKACKWCMMGECWSH